ncbi:dihydrolipoyl dehydrogenase [Bacillus sp. 1NLA3E]|uniref:dihydrolipoyl dehydrogenase n=1 Tax=Bacillus sp. 1NLA3E TaxID=666686 RepID=UPI000247ED14|nr:dihydrolipoyl dehydrogenase [Bacillus sp. 1NLA3E]AGK54222.1 dihydrolipoamide dehydrogenase [Bacillus sp. 1NLA3E]
METIAVIGGGPAGYVAAIKAAQNGKNVILIEEKELGGTCLNEGCIPTKALLKTAETFKSIQNAAHFGIEVVANSVQINWEKAQDYKNNIIRTLVEGVNFLIKQNKIQLHVGKASFITPNLLRVVKGGELELIIADQFIIATGSSPMDLPSHFSDGKWLLNSSHVMNLPAIPISLLIVGGGVIGCEFASIYSRLGTKVTIVEMADQLLPGEDSDIVAVLQKGLEKDGVKIYTASKVSLDEKEMKATIDFKGNENILYPENVLVSIGRKPRLRGLSLEDIGIDFSDKGIIVNEHMQTNIPHIYACGDVIGSIQLAHVAFHEGTVAAMHACGHDVKVNYRAIPRCVYTCPEIASVGFSEAQARKEYGDIRIGEFPFSANSKAQILNETNGKVKVIIENEFHEIVGMSIVGPYATELISQGTVMLDAELTADFFELTTTAHPSVSEAVHEALLQVTGHPLHILS